MLPGIDLRVTALRTGFSKLFVVNDRAAADSDALRSLTLGVKTKELTALLHSSFGMIEAGLSSDAFEPPTVIAATVRVRRVPVSAGGDRGRCSAVPAVQPLVS
ncbi:hypothetical protein ACQEVZ_07285 [Dactylosporangium sp. CA-152071]|uniref:hypothetical protein n=1 Tax=Dactylosporangium sp. CA-152071 TaxID=3239933 RepID=UPI003D8BFDEE